MGEEGWRSGGISEEGKIKNGDKATIGCVAAAVHCDIRNIGGSIPSVPTKFKGMKDRDFEKLSEVAERKTGHEWLALARAQNLYWIEAIKEHRLRDLDESYKTMRSFVVNCVEWGDESMEDYWHLVNKSLSGR